jgi:tRNA(Arg) A34 adenosine deaminase TadA
VRAWLVAEGGILITATGSASSQLPWTSAVTRLIAGVNATFGEERYRYLRRRIFCDGEISTWDRNLVKVCAKRITQCDNSTEDYAAQVNSATRVVDVGLDLLADEDSERCSQAIGSLSLSLSLSLSFSLSLSPMTPRDAIILTAQLASTEQQKFSGAKLHQAPRSVACILLDHSGKLLGANVNTNAGSQLRHAEVNLLLSLAKRGMTCIPDGATLFTSLKPCRMCAAALVPHVESRSLRIIALNDDPGPHGRHQMLASSLQVVSLS